ncbi:AAA family ATPase [Ignisphaera sp. 4213-co]|uniref:AAA family ATPase n=1 Tax=Ignisphaera cupida TaxID=3050454 RepID=A0ABD4Z6E0_9CREN|nr:AAA family ATPase [Ignisphaera sp. 4213-co]MDK6028886.1 AAA family ATPase [Ignisphaera sp. 4213-co]
MENFKSVESAEMELAPLTILIGPPSAGKSNILDAIALAGYFNRIQLLDKEYDNNFSNVESLNYVARFSDVSQLFRNHNLLKKIGISISGNVKLDVRLYFEGGNLKLIINDTPIPWDPRQPVTDVTMSSVRSSLKAANVNMEARLYGFDRYGLSLTYCSLPAPCGLQLRLRDPGLNRPLPKNVLNEMAWNIVYIIKNYVNVISELNRVLKEYLELPVELKLMRSGSICVFDSDVEIEASLLSDSILRILYSILATLSVRDYVKLYGLEGKFILALEEPEAHLYPFLMDVLGKHVTEVLNEIYVVISTHNPLLLSSFWDKVSNIKTYYVYRDKLGSTKVAEIDVSALAKNLVTTDELLLTPPSKVVKDYTVRRSQEG